MKFHLLGSVLLVALLTPLVPGLAEVKHKVEPRREMMVSTSWLAGQMGRGGVIVLHIAPDRESYDRGHIPGARFVPLGEIIIIRDGIPNEMPPVADLQQLFTRLGVGERERIVLYGEPNALSATRTLFTLAYLGHGGRGAILDGGLAKWKAEGRPIEQTPASFSPSVFTPRLNPGLIIRLEAMRDLSWVAANLEPPSVTIVDSRAADVYAGSAEKKTGHIPGAVNRYWMDDLVKESGTLRPPAELREAYQKVGVVPGQLIATYCNTGMQSSHTWFVLRYLGFDSLLYDGSMSEWSRAAGAPIVSGKERR